MDRCESIEGLILFNSSNLNSSTSFLVQAVCSCFGPNTVDCRANALSCRARASLYLPCLVSTFPRSLIDHRVSGWLCPKHDGTSPCRLRPIRCVDVAPPAPVCAPRTPSCEVLMRIPACPACVPPVPMYSPSTRSRGDLWVSICSRYEAPGGVALLRRQSHLDADTCDLVR